MRKFKFYKFKDVEYIDFGGRWLMNLCPPTGNNLFAVLLGNRKNILDKVNRMLENFGIEIVLMRLGEHIYFTMIDGETEEKILYDLSKMLSTDVKKILFYYVALDMCEDSTIIIEDPNVFPYYEKYFAEKIALDESNQYFI